jgi:arylsulfatase A-like enzyme
MKSALIVSSVLTLINSSCNLKDQGKEQLPNIILILADDLGYTELGSYGQKIIETPHIDALAENGIRFTQFYSGSPVCAPSRYTLLTGMHTGKALIRANYGRPGVNSNYEVTAVYERNDILMSDNPALEGSYPIHSETKTFTKLLKTKDYKTAFIGKWGLGGPFSEGVPSRQGFDHYLAYLDQGQAHNYYPLYLWRNDEKIFLNNSFLPRRTLLKEGEDPYEEKSYERYTSNEYAPEIMINEALEFIKSSKDNPFFLYFATIIPHLPYQAPKEWVDKYRPVIGEEEPYYQHHNYFPCRYPRATYAGMISYLDHQVGLIVQELKNQGIYENSIIIFTSDNGPTGEVARYFKSAEPFNPERLKTYVYEGGIRVPMIVSWPKKITSPKVSEHIGASWDLFPTFCDIANIKYEENPDRISLYSELTGKGKQKTHKYLYWEIPGDRGQQAVRMGNWKGIRMGTKDGNLKIKLFNLENDLAEQSDVSEQYPEIVKQIEMAMDEAHITPELKRFVLFDPKQAPRIGDYPRHPAISKQYKVDVK